ncbi:maltase A3-like [Bactrocera neohumeralis]|uniref:maltase A3-like n=1 Tax=Bactrocera neohumeralis TaxID=98809 RepID=UPI002166B467|nr:maltase A3-like [Bactrocera neohumeralis]XP_050319661.1 maltase A3-like [Bactrocera neohumeralis]
MATRALMVVTLLAFCGCSLTFAAKSWWETASFYQIYPRSFKDSDGDGVGDLNGVTNVLPYLKEIGITGAWLSPFLKSPMADFGYDVSNFTDVDPLFGTMEDFERLLAKAKELDIKILLDFVPNHSSDECEWFIKSAARDPVYKDYYMWHPGKLVDGKRQPPNNWVSLFYGSAWQWHEERQEYYLHQFDKKQPDFNFRNPAVREEMNNVLRFWLNKGVDGFRIDAIHHVFEIEADEDGNYADEPLSGWSDDPLNYGYIRHIYTVDQWENPHLVYEWRQVLEDYKAEHGGDERILMIEAWSSLDIMMQYYGNETAEGGQIPFNFQLISYLYTDSNAHLYSEVINRWFQYMPTGRTPNWVIGNHDKSRVATRFGAERIDLFNILLLTLPGCSITYYGDEIGMTDVWISWEETVDPQACNNAQEGYEWRSRDPARTPHQWSDTANAGFTTGQKTWLPIAEDYKLVNVKRQRSVALSHLNVFKNLQQLRKTATLQDGETEVKALNDYVLAVKRSLRENYTYITLLNIFDHIENFNLHEHFADLPTEFEYVLITDRSIRRKGDKTPTSSVTLMPHESIVLRSSVRV